jgi:hypothetical protein
MMTIFLLILAFSEEKKSRETEPPHNVLKGEALFSCDPIQTLADKVTWNT